MCKDSRKYKTMLKAPEDLKGKLKFYFFNKDKLTRKIAQELFAKKTASRKGWNKLNLPIGIQLFYKDFDPTKYPETVETVPQENLASIS